MLNSKQVLFPLGDSYIKAMEKKHWIIQTLLCILSHTYIAYNKFSSSKK